MKWLILACVPVSMAFSQANPLADEKISVPPLILPDIPSVEIVGDGGQGSRESAGPARAVVQSDPVTSTLIERRTGILYQRKKAGDGTLVLRSEQAAMVKVIDLDTSRLECLLWLDREGSIELRALPASHYGVVFCQEVLRRADGRVVPGWIGAVNGEIDLTRPRARVSVSLSIGSSPCRVVASSLAEWNRFNAPASALSMERP